MSDDLIALDKLRKHSCPSCDLDDEERSYIDGWNAALTAAGPALATERQAREQAEQERDQRGSGWANRFLLSEAECARLRDALTGLVAIIDMAGLLNLSNGVQLGPTSWYVKASDRLESARAALASQDGQPKEPR
jgi:hypothetical protein